MRLTLGDAHQPPRPRSCVGVEWERDTLSIRITDYMEEDIAVIDQPDTPTSQSTAARWTFYRRFGLLMRSRLQDDGTTLSLHEVAERTRGRVSADHLIGILSQGAQAQPDAVTCVMLAQAFDVDPDYFVDDNAVAAYASVTRDAFNDLGLEPSDSHTNLQAQALAVLTANRDLATAAAVR